MFENGRRCVCKYGHETKKFANDVILMYENFSLGLTYLQCWLPKRRGTKIILRTLQMGGVNHPWKKNNYS